MVCGYTPGLSEHRNGASLYYDNDRLGNRWTVDGTSKNQLYDQDNAGFGTLTANAGGRNHSVQVRRRERLSDGRRYELGSDGLSLL